MGDTFDAEIGSLLFKLGKIQDQVGGGKKKDVVVNDGTSDKFMDLRAQMLENLKDVKEQLEQVQQMEKNPGVNQRELIGMQSKLRQSITNMNDEFKTLDGLYRAEAKKRRSKFTPEEMAERNRLLQQVFQEIQTVKEMQRSGYMKGFVNAEGYQAVRYTAMEDSEAFRAPKEGEIRSSWGVSGSRNNDMTEQHKSQLQTIKERDARLDEEIGLIGEGVDQLKEIAMQQNEEVKLQNKMLDTLEEKMDSVNEHIVTVNQKLKVTLEEARSSDKICVDIACILLLVGMIIVLVTVVTKK